MKRTLPLLIAVMTAACAGAKLEKQKQEIEQLQEQAGSMRLSLKEKSDEAESLRGAKSELEGKITELEGRTAAAEARVATLTRSNKDLSAAIGASKDELGGKLKAIVAEKDELAQKLSDALKEKLSLERLKSIYQTARDKTARELGKIREERETLMSRLAGLDTQAKKAADEARKSEEARAARRLKTREEMNGVADAVLKELQTGAARIEQSDGGFALALSDAALFEEGSPKVSEGGAALLARAGAALKALPGKVIRVEGHSDNAPFKKGLLGGYEGHWELSAARATAVARWLHEHAGVDPARLSAAGFGEFRPAKPNDTPEGRAANRRVALVVSGD
ncbi:MAG: OmpA family protein [Elusimicrobia bacterium]|nr:OmpA family protein [Elusimicrobiota bacterium]